MTKKICLEKIKSFTSEEALLYNINKKVQKKIKTGSLINIPEIGKKTLKYFAMVRIKDIADLQDKKVDQIYREMLVKFNGEVNRRLLYVCRLVVYFANNENSLSLRS